MTFTTDNLLTAATATGASSDVVMGTRHEVSIQARGSTSSGAGAATIRVEGTNFDDPVTEDWYIIATLSLTLGTTVTTDAASFDSAWRRVRANVTTISGTGASVDVVMVRR